MMNISRARIDSRASAASFRAVPSLCLRAWLSLFCLLAIAAVCLGQTPKPSPTPTPTAPRRPLPKLSNGARGFDAKKKPADASARLIAVGGGWGGEGDPKKPQLKSKTAQGYARLGKEYLKRFEFDKAIPPLEQAVKLNPNYLDAYDSLGCAYAYDGVRIEPQDKDEEYTLKRYRQAIGAFEQALRLAPERADVHLNLGILYFNTGQYRKAVDSLQQGLRLGPKVVELDSIVPIANAIFTDVYRFIGEAYERLGENENAIKAYQQALAVNLDEKGYRLTYSRGRVFRELGQLSEKLGKPDEALTSYQNLVAGYKGQISKPPAEVFSNIGAIYAAKQQYGEAAEAFANAANAYAEDLNGRLRHPPKADAPEAGKKEWKELTNGLETDLVQSLYNLGVAQLNLNRTEKAVESFKTALEHSPNDAATRFNLGFAYHQLGDKKSAAEQAQLLKDIDSELAKELEELINK